MGKVRKGRGGQSHRPSSLHNVHSVELRSNFTLG